MSFPSLTKTYYHKSYPSIDPTRPELAQKDKVIAITGAGGSVGAAAALAFAQAGASKIAVIGRRTNLLEDTKTQVEKSVPGTTVLVVQADIASSTSVSNAFTKIKQELGPIDILVCAAGYLSDFHSLAKAEPEEWWRGFEINTKGAFNVTRAFQDAKAEKGAILVDISTCVVHMPAMASASAYVSSKLAATKVYETFGNENKDVEVTHIHPGVVYSELNVKSGVTATDDGTSQYHRPPLLPSFLVCFARSLMLAPPSRPLRQLHTLGLQSRRRALPRRREVSLVQLGC